ncbi:MAG: hypothetical protein ACOYBY_17435 [Dermatophilaceae bacterium]
MFLKNRGRPLAEPVFRAFEKRLHGAYLMDAYVGPLLTALAPAVWVVPATSGSTLLYSFGRTLSGTSRFAPTLLDAITVPAPSRSVPLGPLPLNAPEHAVHWWAAQLDRAFSTLTDPTLFRDQAGRYDPLAQLEATLTFEQLFRRCTSTRLSYTDSRAAEALGLGVLDIVHRLTGWPINQLAKVAHAQNVLNNLRGSIPVEAHPILLPAAERAVTALQELASEFFLIDADGCLPVHPAKNQRWTPEEAVPHLVKLIRDSTHGYGTKGNPDAAAVAAQLLTRHTGFVPDDLALLPYPYILNLLADTTAMCHRLPRGTLRPRHQSTGARSR